LAAEKEALGLYLSGHPVDRSAGDRRTFGAKTIADLVGDASNGESLTDDEDGTSASRNGRISEDVSVGGIVAAVRPLKTRKGERMAAFTLDDPHGTIEVVVFPDAFSKCASLLQNDTLVLVKGRFERDEDSLRILASEVLPIETVREQNTREVVIRLTVPPHDRRTIEQVSDALARHKGDRRVAFEIDLREAARTLRITLDVSGQIRVRPSTRLTEDVERICGQGSVVLR
jgi:DNA polymerase-3 subunit alpha